MKKLVLLFILAFAFNQNEIKAQLIVNPIGEEVAIIDINATDIVLKNITTGDVYSFQTAVEMYASWSSLSCGNYRAEFNLNGRRLKARFIKDDCGQGLSATESFSTFTRSGGRCN